eukprot:9860364-Prorocentrum_lima.AAC.1
MIRIYVPTSSTNRVDLGVTAPYPTVDRAEEHPGQGAQRDTSPTQPPASQPPSEQLVMAGDEEHPGVPL